jgi:pimeloyl-ACP methyl ester carboxylesterase
MDQPAIAFDTVEGQRIAFRFREGRSPTLIFLPGYASDMEGSKALALDQFAGERGLAMLRFDYSGTGSSEGEFDEGTLGVWLAQALHMLDAHTSGPVIVVGSSMGGWIGLHLAVQRPDCVAALVGLAAAPDFTEWGFPEDLRQRLRRDGRIEAPNPYGPEPYVTTLAFWESGQSLRLLNEEIPIDCPVRLIHGDADREVPVKIALKLVEQLRSADVQLTIIKGAAHRLSEPREIGTILRAVAGLVESVA